MNSPKHTLITVDIEKLICHFLNNTMQLPASKFILVRWTETRINFVVSFCRRMILQIILLLCISQTEANLVYLSGQYIEQTCDECFLKITVTKCILERNFTIL